LEEPNLPQPTHRVLTEEKWENPLREDVSRKIVDIIETERTL